MFQNNPISFLFKKLWQFSPNRRKQIILSSTLIIISGVIELMPPLVLAHILNLIQIEGITPDNIWYITGVLFFNYVLLDHILPWSIWYPARIIEQKTAFLARINYRNYLVKGALSLGINWHNNQKSGNLVDKINKATDELYDFSAWTFRIVKVLIDLLGSMIIITAFNWRLVVILPVFMLVILWNISRWDKKLIPAYKSLSEKENTIQEKIIDNFTNITSIKILQLENSVKNIINKFSVKPKAIDHKKNIDNEIKWMTTDLFLKMLLFVIMGGYIWWNYAQNIFIKIGTLTALFQYLHIFSGTMFSVADVYNGLMIKKARIENAETLEEDFNKILKIRSHKKLPKDWKKIFIPHLSFDHEDSKHKKHAINIEKLNINRGQKIALLGESGSGKTTFLKLLRGLYQINKTIKVDEKSEKNNFNFIHNSSMLVPQEPEIFATTIKENIDMHLNIPRKKLKKFVKIAQFEKILEKLPKQWKTQIGEKGVNLSGGEKQRLALTRALVFCEDKDIILLDESTSSVDSINELLIYKNIFRAFKEKTVFASIHKLNLIQEFDRIILFKNGEIIVDGSFDELQKKSPEFNKLWKNYQNKA